MCDEVTGPVPAPPVAAAAAETDRTDSADDVTPAITVPAIAPPPGIRGLFDEYDPNELLDMSQFKAEQVFCNIYDLGDSDVTCAINDVLTGGSKMLIGGLFHVGIEVFGTEWSFGQTEEDRSGVFSLAPRSFTQHTYRTTVPLGETGMSMQEAQEVTDRLSKQWKGNEYDIIHKNCLNFANRLCRELGVREIPGWVDRVPQVASTIATTAGEVEDTVLDALPDDELVGQVAEDLSKKAEVVAAKFLGEDLAAKAKQVSEHTQQQAHAFTCSLWRAAWSVTQDLQEDPAPPSTD